MDQEILYRATQGGRLAHGARGVHKVCSPLGSLYLSPLSCFVLVLLHLIVSHVYAINISLIHCAPRLYLRLTVTAVTSRPRMITTTDCACRGARGAGERQH